MIHFRKRKFVGKIGAYMKVAFVYEFIICIGEVIRMKNLKKIVAVAFAALSVTTFAMGITGCSKEPYSFEAEEAEIVGYDSGMFPMCYEEGTEYQADAAEDAEALKIVGMTNFAYSGNEILWKITSDKAAEATLILRLASNVQEMQTGEDGMPIFGAITVKEVDVASAMTLTVNNQDVAISGTLPGSNSLAKVIYEAKVTVNLVAGENTILLAATGEEGCNVFVDKLLVDTKAKLTFTPIDNTELTWGNLMGGSI